MSDSRVEVDSIHFGTDGWRAIIGEDFNLTSLARVAAATARAYRELLDNPSLNLSLDSSHSHEFVAANPNRLIVGYDCRQDAAKYAAYFAEVLGEHGFDVLVSDRFCPTPTLCWTVAQDLQAIGGVMLTASHNPAEYLGVKLRMSDGGASPAWFTDMVEALLEPSPPASAARAQEIFDATPAGGAINTADTSDSNTSDNNTSNSNGSTTTPPTTPPNPVNFSYADLMTNYLAALATSVDRDLIRTAKLSVVLDPMYGAGRGYLSNLLTDMGVTVDQVNGASDPTFAGLHPEPIMPWVSVGAARVAELGYAACLINDGDADRIGAVDGHGNYVTSHRIASLLVAHLVEGRGQRGRVVRTSAGSNLIKRQCERLGLELTTKPIGFKWVYEEMLRGDVLIGGEESGGFGMPNHVRERDGLLMALLLVEMMAMRSMTLSELVDQLLEQLGVLEYARRDLRLTDEQVAAFLATHVNVDGLDYSAYIDTFAALGEEIIAMERVDGIMLRFASDAWLLARPSGTEPLVRVYAEANSSEQVERLLDIGCALAKGE